MYGQISGFWLIKICNAYLRTKYVLSPHKYYIGHLVTGLQAILP